jgi:hypothetical protein
MKFSLLAVLLALTACASSSSSKSGSSAMPTGDDFAKAATTPLSDLNLIRAEIPAILSTAEAEPYAVPADKSCAALANEIQALDSALGADLDTPPTSSNPGLVERGSDAIGHAASDALQSAAEDLVPFRGWVRKISGAERYSREVAAAIAAGSIRRAFLKGLGQAAECPAPAAPRR